jgi:hypothetical protein
MRKILLFSVIIPLSLSAQVSEDFSDGDFTQDPSWNGDLSHFKISSSSAVPQLQRPALQLDAPAAGTSALSVSQPLSGDLEWQFWAKLSLNTTSGNFARVYLFSDKADLKAPLEGYFLQLGGSNDSVLFFRQDSLENISLLRMNTAFTGNSTNVLRFRVLRSKEGAWQFYCDSIGGQSLSLQGEINDLVLPGGSYFGFSCQYTSSNTTRFYFDDFYAGPVIVDSVPPSLLQAVAVNPGELLLTFSEAVDLASAEDTAHYEITPGLGHPYEALRLPDQAQVHLFFDLEMAAGEEYSLNIFSVRDLAGNESGLLTVPVWYYRVMPYDLIFTEIMADPSPPRDLPEYEYLELYNRSPVALNIEGLRLKISSTEHLLPPCNILPGGYLLICADDAVEVMQHLAPATGIPSFVLPNSGAAVELSDTAGRTLSFLQYDLSWYKDDAKAEGGWSLEMIDIDNPCKMAENWTASVRAEGGTPGMANSAADQLESWIKILNACCLGDSSLLVEFSESLDSLTVADTSRYMAEPFLGQPGLAMPVPPDFRSVYLLFNQEITRDQIYTLTVNPGIRNCVGNELAAALEAFFAPSQQVEPFDIVINEILFNPIGDGVDYVEVCNRSDKTIDLEELILASVKISTPDVPDTQFVDISTSCRAIFPSQYLALTSDPGMVKSQFYTEDPAAFLKMPSFPSYNNDQGTVLLMNKDGSVIDMMNYSEEMHFLMLLSYDGVALERISPERPGTDPSNWHSAAETAGFGTPGYRNSQYLETSEASSSLSIQPEVFSPDGDGRDDNLGIVYHFDFPGKLITVLIFNADGRLVRTLVNNEMPGTQGVYSWDGTLDDRAAAQNGIYIIYMEVLGMDGKTRHFKKAGVLARNH